MKSPEKTSLFNKLTSKFPGIIYQFKRAPDGKFSMPFVTAQFTEVFGLLPEDVWEDATPVFEKIFPPDLSSLFQSIDKSEKSLTDWQYEFRIVHPEGGIRWLRGMAQPEKMEDDAILWYGYILDVTNRKQIEQDNQNTRIKYQGYFESATEGLFIVNRQGEYVEANPAACKMTGYSQKELLSMQVKDLVDPEFNEQEKRTLDRSFETGSLDEEILLKRKDGKSLWVRLVTSTINTNTLIAFCHDITQKKKQENLLKMQLDFQKLIANVSSGFVNAKGNSFDLAVNHALKQTGIFFKADRCYVFLFSPDYSTMSNTHEWYGKGIEPQIENLQNFKTRDASWWWSQIKNKKIINLYDVANHPGLSNFEKKLFAEQEVKSLLSIPMINNGKLMGFFGLDRVVRCKGWTDTEITQFNLVAEILSSSFSKSRAEDALRQSENRYRLLAENARDVIFRISLHPEKRYEYISPSSESLTGYSPEEYYANPGLDVSIIHPDDVKAINDLYNQKHGFDRPAVMRLICKNKQMIWCEQSNVPIYNKKGALVAVEGIARDITEQKEYEERLKQLNVQLLEKKRDLELLNQSLEERIAAEVEKNRGLDHLMALQARQAALGEMIANIAHQWRQPLNVLSLAIYDLAEAWDFGELDKNYFDQSMQEMNRVIQDMSKTIDDFRNFFKPENEKTFFKVSDVISNTLTFMAPYFTDLGAIIRKDVPLDIKAYGYPSQLEQVIMNILKNALDAFEEQSTQLCEISIKLRGSGNAHCLLEIVNSGKHIPEIHLSRLFDPYFTTKPQGKGLGLGLYVSKTIIEKNMNGNIYCENTDQGVKFVIELNAPQTE